MSDETRNVLQDLVVRIREFLEPLALGVTDVAVRREILLSVGLDPAHASQPLSVPPSALASIDAYRQQAAEDADLKAIALGSVRTRQPGVYATAKALQLIEEQALRFGGITQLLFRSGEFFEQL